MMKPYLHILSYQFCHIKILLLAIHHALRAETVIFVYPWINDTSAQILLMDQKDLS